MTKKLEELFNLPPVVDLNTTCLDSDDYLEDIENSQLAIAEVNSAIDKIDIALPVVKDLAASDEEMDDLAKLATDSFTNLMDLALNVEARFSGPILQSASAMLGHAVTVKIAKMDKKLKMIDLQLKKAKIDQAVVKKPPIGEDAIEGEGVVMTRNDLLKSILGKSTSDENVDDDSES